MVLSTVKEIDIHSLTHLYNISHVMNIESSFGLIEYQISGSEVARASSITSNARDSLYQSLPSGIQLASRSKISISIRSFWLHKLRMRWRWEKEGKNYFRVLV